MISHCLCWLGCSTCQLFIPSRPKWPTKAFFLYYLLSCSACTANYSMNCANLEHDLKAGLRHTAAILGHKATFRLMVCIALLGVAAGVISYSCGPYSGLAADRHGCAGSFFFIPPLLKIEKQKPSWNCRGLSRNHWARCRACFRPVFSSPACLTNAQYPLGYLFRQMV